MAQTIARDIPEGSFVNLGIGQPTRIADHLPRDEQGNARVVLHTENGMLGMGRKVTPELGDTLDPDLTNAGKVPVIETPAARTSTTPTPSR